MCTVPDIERDAYNGWTNRETWAVALWINNEQGMQESVYDCVRELTEDAKARREEGGLPEWGDRLAASYAGDAVREYVEELFDVDNYGGSLPGGLVSMLTDIGSLYRVDWHELGASFLQDAMESAQ
jgi:hypothetical protein